MIPNGIDIAFYAPQPKRAAIMAAGRLWDEAKNLALLDDSRRHSRLAGRDCRGSEPPEGGQARLRAARALGVLTPAETGRTARGEPRSMRRRRGTNLLALAFSKPPPAAARWCSATFRRLRENWDGAALFAPPNDVGAWRTTLSCLIACEFAAGGARHCGAPSCPRFLARTYGHALRRTVLRAGLKPREPGEGGGFRRNCTHSLHLPTPVAWAPSSLPWRAERGSGCGLNMPKLVLFCHSLRSDWNHGNAHFLRGILAEWRGAGFSAVAWEPSDAWSARNLAAEHGETALDAWREAYPDLPVTVYDPAALDLDQALDSADLVIVHEWSAPDLVARIAAHRRASGRYLLLFHDTHHRMATDPEAIARFDLDGFDGVLAFGEVLSEAYRRRFWGRQVFTWHEAADLSVFRPVPEIPRARDLVWIGNWGDDERTDGIVRVSDRAGQGSRPVGPRARRALPAGGPRRARRRRHRLCRLSAEFPGAASLRRGANDSPCSAPTLCDGIARHPDNPRLRGARLRHPARLRAVA